MAEAPKDPKGAPDSGTTQMPKASLSQKADKLTARLEEHKHKAKAEADAKAQAARAAAPRPAPAPTSAPASAPTATSAPAPTVVAPVLSVKASAPKAAPKVTKPTVSTPAPTVSTPAPIEDVIRAIKLPHEVAAEKPVAAPTAAPEPAKTASLVPPVSVAPKDPEQSTAAAVAQARTRVFGSYTPEPVPSPAALKRRVARERALNSKPALGRAAQVIVAVIFPVLTLITAIRLIATPGFLALSYGRPGFPDDLFGFTSAQRLTYGSYGLDYLNNFAGPEYLSGLKLYTGSTMFTESEVQHMVDVKNLIGFAYILGVVLALILIICLWYLAKRYAGGVRRALFAGSIVTLVMIAALTVLAMLGWETFFTDFHELFFSQGNWTFSLSDTLIRLYPDQFWIDSAVSIAGLVLLTVLVTLLSCWPTGRRREAARLRQEARAFGLGN